ncbi:MAG: hypothetical protein AUK37_01225 [Rhodobacterales bacterium CG2_30_65_12]|nr:MAG: hypothetical protein AUK37_01225 [Rhodobacterales bacterium CG2_30_65_12]
MHLAPLAWVDAHGSAGTYGAFAAPVLFSSAFSAQAPNDWAGCTGLGRKAPAFGMLLTLW